MFSREICDVKHPSIKDADELIVYFPKENQFRLINRIEYPKPRGSICQLCPNGWPRTSGTVICCQTKVETWSTFKAHLVTVERIFGELVAFPADTDFNDLPDISIYSKKHRAYGQLGDYQEKEQIYIFDVKKNRFIWANRSVLSKMYTRFGCCNYCPCTRRVQSPSSILQHMQSIENRFFCYLILDNESQNDRRNKEKIQIFVNSVKNDDSYSKLTKEIQTIKSSNRSSVDYTQFFTDYHTDEEQSQSSESLSMNGEFERMNGHHQNSSYENGNSNQNSLNDQENTVIVLNQMEKSFKNDCKKMAHYFGKLKRKMNVTDLNQSIINSQEQLILSNRSEDPETQDKKITFTKKLKLDRDDLKKLLIQHGVPKSYKIKNVEISLNLNLKIKQSIEDNFSDDLQEDEINEKMNDENDENLNDDYDEMMNDDDEMMNEDNEMINDNEMVNNNEKLNDGETLNNGETLSNGEILINGKNLSNGENLNNDETLNNDEKLNNNEAQNDNEVAIDAQHLNNHQDLNSHENLKDDKLTDDDSFEEQQNNISEHSTVTLSSSNDQQVVNDENDNLVNENQIPEDVDPQEVVIQSLSST